MPDTKQIADGKITQFLERNSKFKERYQPFQKFWDVIPAYREARQTVIVLSCSDPRLDVKQILGINEDPMISGRAYQGINAIAAAQAVNHCGTIVVIHHDDCGMSHVHDEDVKKYLLEISPEDRENPESSSFWEIVTP